MNNFKKKLKEIIIITIFVGLIITGCGKGSDKLSATDYKEAEETILEEASLVEEKAEGTKGNEENINELFVIENNEPIDYETVRKSHEILYENICETYYSIYDNPWLCEQLAHYIELTKEFDENYSMSDKRSSMDYILFDFNDDGIDEYITSFNGSGWTGSAGNSVRIFEKMENGNLKEIYAVTAELYNYEGVYWPIVILNEKTNGYYDFILPWSFNDRIWQFDQEKGRYDSYEDSVQG